MVRVARRRRRRDDGARLSRGRRRLPRNGAAPGAGSGDAGVAASSPPSGGGSASRRRFPSRGVPPVAHVQRPRVHEGGRARFRVVPPPLGARRRDLDPRRRRRRRRRRRVRRRRRRRRLAKVATRPPDLDARRCGSQLFGCDDADDAAYDASPDADADADAACDAPFPRARRRRRGAGFFLCPRRAPRALVQDAARSPASPTRPGSAVRVRRRRRGRGGGDQQALVAVSWCPCSRRPERTRWTRRSARTSLRRRRCSRPGAISFAAAAPSMTRACPQRGLIGAAARFRAHRSPYRSRVSKRALATFEALTRGAVASRADVVVRLSSPPRSRVGVDGGQLVVRPDVRRGDGAARRRRLGGVEALGGSAVSLVFDGLAVSASQTPSQPSRLADFELQLPQGAASARVGPVAGTARPGGDAGGAAVGATRVSCVAPAKREGAAEGCAGHPRTGGTGSTSTDDPVFATDASDASTHYSVIDFVTAARPAFACPPAASAVGGGVFGGDRGIAVPLDVPGPAPETLVAADEIKVRVRRRRRRRRARRARAPERKHTPSASPRRTRSWRASSRCTSSSTRRTSGTAFFPAVALVSDPKYQTQISFECVARARARAQAPPPAHAGGDAASSRSRADLRRDASYTRWCARWRPGRSASPFAAAVPVAVAVSSALVA